MLNQIESPEKFVIYVISSTFVSAHAFKIIINLSYSNTVVHQRAIGVVSNLLYCHDLDPRFNDPLMRSKIAQLYLPLISIACDVLDQLWNPAATARTGSSGDGIDLSIARAISTSNVPGARPIGIEMALKVRLLVSSVEVIGVGPLRFLHGRNYLLEIN